MSKHPKPISRSSSKGNSMAESNSSNPTVLEPSSTAVEAFESNSSSPGTLSESGAIGELMLKKPGTIEEYDAAILAIRDGALKRLEIERQELLNSERPDKIKQIKAWISLHAIGSDELYESKIAPSNTTVKATNVRPRYQNPNNPLEIWGGYGRRPGWIIKLVGKDGDIEHLKIQQ